MSSDRRATRANYDRLSRWYDLLSGSSERPARMHGLHMLDVRSGERVLEIGCGTGEALSVLASRAGDAGGVFGLDLSGGMLRKAESKLRRDASNVLLVQAEALHLPFADGNFDALFLSFTLELFPAAEMPTLLMECRRVLRPGGRLGIVSLLQMDKPNWMERAYTWTHHRWPAAIDCRPIALQGLLMDAGWNISRFEHLSMWGLEVGCVVAVGTLELKKDP